MPSDCAATFSPNRNSSRSAAAAKTSHCSRQTESFYPLKYKTRYVELSRKPFFLDVFFNVFYKIHVFYVQYIFNVLDVPALILGLNIGLKNFINNVINLQRICKVSHQDAVKNCFRRPDKIILATILLTIVFHELTENFYYLLLLIPLIFEMAVENY